MALEEAPGSMTSSRASGASASREPAGSGWRAAVAAGCSPKFRIEEEIPQGSRDLLVRKQTRPVEVAPDNHRRIGAALIEIKAPARLAA
jgi:hypothetical protein